MKKSLYIVVIIIIILICIFASSSDNTSENNIIKNETKMNEIVKNNNIVNQVNDVVVNEVTNEITNETIINETENNVSTEKFEESPKTAEEKAIDIVKKDWGNSNNVNFSVQGMDGNGNYIISVTDSNTVALAFYTVNVSNETFTKREMN